MKIVISILANAQKEVPLKMMEDMKNLEKIHFVF